MQRFITIDEAKYIEFYGFGIIYLPLYYLLLLYILNYYYVCMYVCTLFITVLSVFIYYGIVLLLLHLLYSFFVENFLLKKWNQKKRLAGQLWLALALAGIWYKLVLASYCWATTSAMYLYCGLCYIRTVLATIITVLYYSVPAYQALQTTTCTVATVQ